MVKILVVKPSSLGDLLNAAPAVELLSRAPSKPSISWVVNEEYTDFVKSFPGVAEVIPFPRQRMRWGSFPRWVPGIVRWLRGLRRDFQVAVDFQGLQRSGLMTRFSRAPERFGLRDARELGWIHYNRRILLSPECIHALDRCIDLAGQVLARSAFLGCDPAAAGRELEFWKAGMGAWRLPVPEEHRSFAKAALGDDGASRVALCPGARWKSKLWPAESWIDLVRRIRSAHPRIELLVLGGSGEVETATRICEGSGDAVKSWAGETTPWQAAALLERCRAAVTLDSALLHMAASLGVPTVSLFGPTDPARLAPRGPGHRVLRRSGLECLACRERRCPLPRRQCLVDIPAEDVLEALESPSV